MTVQPYSCNPCFPGMHSYGRVIKQQKDGVPLAQPHQLNCWMVSPIVFFLTLEIPRRLLGWLTHKYSFLDPTQNLPLLLPVEVAWRRQCCLPWSLCPSLSICHLLPLKLPQAPDELQPLWNGRQEPCKQDKTHPPGSLQENVPLRGAVDSWFPHHGLCLSSSFTS